MQSAGRYKNQRWLLQRRQHLRKNETKVEGLLWEWLRRKQLGVKFRRQFNVDHYILDFYCHSLKLIVEVDGFTHDDPGQKWYDKKRDQYFRFKGYTVLRYKDEMVFQDCEIITEDIKRHISLLKTPPSLP